MLSASRLIYWSKLHSRRAPTAARWALALAVLIGAALAFELSRRSSAADQQRAWMIALIGTSCMAFVTAPFRMFWSRDADALSRHPIAGRPLYRLGVARNLAVAVGCSLPSFISIAGFAVSGHAAIAARHALLAAAALSATALLAPACAVLAGGLAASERAEAIAASFGGEFRAPRGAYLGIVPGVICAAVVLLLIGSSDWALASQGSALPVTALALMVASAAAAVTADARADRILPAAVRELSALNRRRLAHVEATKLSQVERVACALTPASRRAVVRKDLMLLRRRFPAFNLVHAGSTIGAWVLALRWHDAFEWIAALLVLMHTYSVLMAWRSMAPPIEEPRLAATLPLSAGDLRRCKRTLAHLRALTISIAIGGALFVAATPAFATAVVVGCAMLASAAAAVAIAR